MRLILLAHAETDATRSARFPRGESLNPRGRRAARQQRLVLPRPRAAYASLAPAACETASLAGFEAAADDALRDLDVGRWSGCGPGEIAAGEADAFAAWIADARFAGHGGESRVALVRRIAAWLAARRADKGTVLAITHAAVLRAALTSVLDAPASAFWCIDVPPLTAMHFSSDGRRWALREIRHAS